MIMTHWFRSVALFAIFTLLIPAVLAASSMPIIPLTLGSGSLEVEVASDQSQRAQGLMYRTAMASNQGMLFVYPAPAYFCMWMKNTMIPLSVAFIDAQGRVINIAEMKPQTQTNHCTERNATYALEVNQGWFAKHGVQSGTQIIGLEKAPQGKY
jgi:uncharacterized membrane protein (UPF0127 family)